MPLDLLLQVRESHRGATPEPGDRMREGELAVIPFIQAQLDIGFRPVSIGRWLRVAGDSLRRMAELESDAWRTDLMEPVLARGGSAEDLGATSSSDESLRLDEATNEALVALWHARQVHTWTNNIISGFEQALTIAGMLDHALAAAGDLFPGHHRLHAAHQRARRRCRGRPGARAVDAGAARRRSIMAGVR